MELFQHFKSLIDQDNTAVVICGTDHRIVYMNPTACRHYAKYGGASLLGRSLLDCHDGSSREKIHRVLAWFRADPAHNRVHTFYNEKQHKDGYMIALRDPDGTLIGYYEKHEYRDRDETPLYVME